MEESKGGEADNEEDEESSYYDTEEESEGEKDQTAQSTAAASTSTQSKSAASAVYQGLGAAADEAEQMRLAAELKNRVIDLSGNFRADKATELEAQQIITNVKKREAENYEKAELFLKMKAEWESL